MAITNILDHVKTAHGQDFYKRLLESFYSELKADYLFIARLDSESRVASTQCVLVDGKLSNNFSYDLQDTPCADVSDLNVCVVPTCVQQHYPNDQLLIDMGVQGYVGVPLLNEADEVIGILVALYKTEIHQKLNVESLFRLFTGRLSAEMIRDEAESRLNDINNELKSILNNLNDAVLTVSEEGTILSANVATFSMFGYSKEELLGQNVTVLMPQEYAAAHHRYVENYLRGGEAKIIGVGRELPAQKKDGTRFYMELNLSELEIKGKRCFVGIIKDITERKNAVEDVYRLAYYDEVTGVPNLKSFEIKTKELLAKSELAQASVFCCLLNLDQFSQCNIAYGKETGDYILQSVASRIRSKIGDEFSLYKGLADTFLIVKNAPLIDASVENQHKFDELIFTVQRFIAADMVFHGLSHKISCRASSVTIEATDMNFGKLLGMLEFGQKSGKQRGAGSRTSLSKEDFSDYDRNVFISNSFGRAIRDEEFYVVLQPQIDQTGRVVASELLLRWEHAVLGNIRPDEFIPIAERSEDIIDISRWVLQSACRILSTSHAQGVATRLAINVSGNHIARHDFAQDIIDTTEVWGINPRDLVLEITETALVNNIELVRRHINLLSERGFSFSIDDFGTGYSSLSYLKELPIHELKVDRYFINEIESCDKDVPIVNSIIDMAKALHLKTVAEGIENITQLDYLKSKGCDYFQGYYFSKPIDEESWLAFVRNNCDLSQITST